MLKRLFVSAFVTCILVFACSNVSAQKREIRNPYKRPGDFLKPAKSAPYMRTKEYRQAHQELERDFWRIHEPDEKQQILSQSKESVLRVLEVDKDFWNVAKARYWCMKHAPEIIPDLIKLVENPKIVGLEDAFDLIIWERNLSKDLPFYGHGWVVPDDLFSVAGRGSWILREITGQRFSAVSMKSTPAELKQLSAAWAKWYEKNK